MGLPGTDRRQGTWPGSPGGHAEPERGGIQRRLIAGLAGLGLGLSASAAAQEIPKPEGTIRIATFNASLARDSAGELIEELRRGSKQVANVAHTIAAVGPDILLVNELDHDKDGEAARLLAENHLSGSLLPVFAGPSNTGVPSGLDLDGDGRSGGPGDALGYGRFEGQYGMALFSRLPLAADAMPRTFRTLPWRDLPGARLPDAEPGSGRGDWYGEEALAILPLSSKSHWDVPLALPDGRVLHILASHPTPPVFDGPEDRNGLRNADEIRFWQLYIEGTAFRDDAGRVAAIPDDASFVILGDLNNDPLKGDGDRGAIRDLTSLVRVSDVEPRGSASGTDTAQFRQGNLRVDYVLPSSDLPVAGSGVYWPREGEPGFTLIGPDGRATSDHRLVWVDILLE